MSDQYPATIPALIKRMEQSRAALEAAVGSVDKALLATPGPGGWSVRDHLAHLAAWENSIVALLQGIPRHVGLGVGQDLYASGSEDDINAAIVETARSSSFDQVLARYGQVHREMLDILSRLTDAGLQRSYGSFLPEETGEGSGPPVIGWIAGNTYEHYDEHAEWIRELARALQR